MKNKVKLLIKKHWSNLLFIIVISLLVFHPDAKTWVLRQLFSVGLFKADISEPKEVAGTYSLSFTNIKGELVTTSDLKGKVVFINFWATWCPPCRAEMPSINELYKKLKTDERFVFLMVDADGDLSSSTAYMKKHNFDLDVYASAGTISPELYSGTLPTTIVLGKNGRLVSRHEGISNYNSKKFEEQLLTLAAK